MSNRNGYPIVGGPLNGSLARGADFQGPSTVHRWNCKFGEGVGKYKGYKEGDIYPGGNFAGYAYEYVALNRASGYAAVPSRVWLHKDVLRGAGVKI
jgi:hypothetical protein